MFPQESQITPPLDDDVATTVHTVHTEAAAEEARRAKPPVISLAVGVMDINTSPNTVGDTIIHHTIRVTSIATFRRVE